MVLWYPDFLGHIFSQVKDFFRNQSKFNWLDSELEFGIGIRNWNSDIVNNCFDAFSTKIIDHLNFAKN